MTGTPEGVEAAMAFLSAEPPPPEAGIEGLRSWIDSFGRMFPIQADMVVSEIRLGDLLVKRLTPLGANPRRAILYLHGGAYVAGSFASHGGMVAALAQAAGATLDFVEFRRAPEHAYPAALDDALAAHRALRADHAPGDIIVAGDSAGGGLALALLLALKAAGEPMPAAASGPA